jgi:hypothetical protein
MAILGFDDEDEVVRRAVTGLWSGCRLGHIGQSGLPGDSPAAGRHLLITWGEFAEMPVVATSSPAWAVRTVIETLKAYTRTKSIQVELRATHASCSPLKT